MQQFGRGQISVCARLIKSAYEPQKTPPNKEKALISGVCLTTREYGTYKLNGRLPREIYGRNCAPMVRTNPCVEISNSIYTGRTGRCATLDNACSMGSAALGLKCTINQLETE